MNTKVPVTYHLSVYTKNQNNAGTDAKVCIKLTGSKGESGAIALKDSKTHKDKFESGHVDVFDVTMADIGEIESAIIWHDNSGYSADWFLDRVVVDSNFHGKAWTLPCNQWLAKNRGDHKTERELYVDAKLTKTHQKSVLYSITTYTSDIENAGTRSHVFVALTNSNSEATKLHRLEASRLEDRETAFQRGSKYTFLVEMEDIGDDIETLRIGIDHKGRSPCWHLDKVVVIKMGTPSHPSISYLFRCNLWFSKVKKRAADQHLIRDLPLTTQSTVLGKNQIELIHTSTAAHDDCCDDDEDDDDDVNHAAGMQSRKSVDLTDGLKHHDHDHDHNGDANGHVHTKHSHRLSLYKLHTKTAADFGAGTDSQVFITIYGEHNDSGELMLEKSETYEDSFESGHVDTFTIETVQLGPLYMICIRTDGTGSDAAWKLDYIKVVDDKQVEYAFEFNDWLNMTNAYMAYLICKPTAEEKSGSQQMLRKRNSVDDITKYIIALSLANNRLVISKGDDEEDGDDEKEKDGEGNEEAEAEEHEDDEEGNGEETAAANRSEDPTFRYNLWVRFETEIGLTEPLYFRMPQHQVLVKRGPMGVQVVTEKPRYISIPFSHRTFGRVKKILMVGVKDMSEDTNLDGKRPYALSWYCDRMMIIDTKRAIRVTAVVQRSIPIVLDLSQAVRFSQCLQTRSLEEELKERLDLLKKTSVRYEVTAYTGDEMMAGTDSNVFLVIKGQYGTTPTLQLDTPKDKKNYDRLERNTFDTFIVPSMEVGRMNQVVIWHDGNGLCSSWLLEKLEILHPKTKQKYVFNCRQWIGSGESLTLNAMKSDELAMQKRRKGRK